MVNLMVMMMMMMMNDDGFATSWMMVFFQLGGFNGSYIAQSRGAS